MTVMIITDVVSNSGKVHKGVSVSGIDVGGLTPEQATKLLDTELTHLIQLGPVEIIPDDVTFAGLQRDPERQVRIDLDINLQDASGAGLDPRLANSWRVNPLTVIARANGAQLAEQAYQVGRGKAAVWDRFTAWVFGIDLPGALEYDENQFNDLVLLLNTALGKPVVNADLVYQNGSFEVTSAQDGFGVDAQVFEKQLTKAFLSSDRQITLTLVELTADIDESEASSVAETCRLSITQPIDMLSFVGAPHKIPGNMLGSWMETRIEGRGNSARLVPFVSPEKLQADFNEVIGDSNLDMPPQDASFMVKGESLVIIPGQPGLGVDYQALADEITGILFSPEEEGAKRQLALPVATLEPLFTTADAEALRVTQKIASASTSYAGSEPARAHNVETAARYANNALITPRQEWSFITVVGDPTVARGFQESMVISGAEYVDGIGGGVCQVATTVYMAVFDAGYPIISRAAHGIYQWRYPPGRDATVYYPWLDLIWENDTDNWILLTVTCDGENITASLWGANPGYRVEIESGDWQAGQEFNQVRRENSDLKPGQELTVQKGFDGGSIAVTRKVYDRDGKLLRDTTFLSDYGPEDEIVEYGPEPPGPL
ncbi:MAG: VanW family protein [Coriobacteriales bacterium]|jgi:vancomycin resistance protein YoaR|nr:VanW family protein [Coriobacteriales bacterium]